MMETVINDTLKKEKWSFYSKWDSFLKDNNATVENLNDFKAYFNNVYKGIRLPSVHPVERIGLRNSEMFQFTHVHEHIKHGWFSFVFLLNKKLECNMDKNENWKEMCKIHDVPDAITKEDFPNLEKLAELLFKKHTDGFNDKG
jgi:hypothetical protein